MQSGNRSEQPAGDEPELWMLTGDVARACAVTPETVRFWHRIGRLTALKTERGVRVFNRRDVERLARERQAKERAK
jgi:DNA-binding transcriptional MerR regulator